MKPSRWSILFGVLLLLSTVSVKAQAGDAMTLVSGPSSSQSFAAGVGLSSLIKLKLLPSHQVDLLALNSNGAVDNIRKLLANDAQFAILPSAVGHAARLGDGSFKGDPPATGLRAIAALWRDALHLVMRNDDVATGTIDDLRRLKDGRIFLGQMSSGMQDAHHLLLGDLDLETARTIDPSRIANGDGVSAMRQGKVDVFSAAARPPEAALIDLFDGQASNLRLLDVTERQMTEVNGNHWLWTPYVIPAATYPGQSEDVWTIALSTLLVVRSDVDADLVHAITKSIFDNLDYLHRVDPTLADLTLKSALSGVTMPLHPGALRYYEEAGLVATMSAAAPIKLPQPPTPNELDAPKKGFERYPNDNVAGDWPKGLGGPYLKTGPALKQPEAQDPVELNWRRRATL